MNLPDRILNKIVFDTNGSGCWLWSGALSNGYGSTWGGRSVGRAVLVHRLVFESLTGPVPTGLELDHLCRNRACCNPDHLEPVTSRVNTMRGIGPALCSVRGQSKTHCKRGHELPCIRDKFGRRRCNRCVALRMRGYRAAHAA